jgi:hypothetical protein
MWLWQKWHSTQNKYGIHQFIPLSYLFLSFRTIFRQDNITGNYTTIKQLHPQDFRRQLCYTPVFSGSIFLPEYGTSGLKHVGQQNKLVDPQCILRTAFVFCQLQVVLTVVMMQQYKMNVIIFIRNLIKYITCITYFKRSISFHLYADHISTLHKAHDQNN